MRGLADRGEVLSIGFVVRQIAPVLGREVVEGKERLSVLQEALDSLGVFGAPRPP